MSIPRFSRLLNIRELLRLDGYLIVQFKVKGANFISYKQLFSNTSFQALTVLMSWSTQMTSMFIQ